MFTCSPTQYTALHSVKTNRHLGSRKASNKMKDFYTKPRCAYLLITTRNRGWRTTNAQNAYKSFPGTPYLLMLWCSTNVPWFIRNDRRSFYKERKKVYIWQHNAIPDRHAPHEYYFLRSCRWVDFLSGKSRSRVLM